MNHKDTKTQRQEGERGDGLHDHRGRPLDTAVQRLSYDVVGAAIEVHHALGPGWLESAYEEALCVELSSRRISFVRQREVQLMYKGRRVGEGHIDILVNDCLVLELKPSPPSRTSTSRKHSPTFASPGVGLVY